MTDAVPPPGPPQQPYQQQPTPQQPYPQPHPQGGMPPAFGGPPPGYTVARTNTNAVISLVTSICSWILCPGVLAIVGLVTGVIGRRQIRESNGTETGDGLAIGGIIISILNIVLLLGFIVLIAMVTLLGKNSSSKFSSVASAIN